MTRKRSRRTHIFLCLSLILGIGTTLNNAFAHGMMGPPPMPPGGGMMGPAAPPPPPGGGMMPTHVPMMPHGHGPARPSPGYGAYGRANPWWGESYMDGWYMMPWMMGGQYNNNARPPQSPDNAQNNGRAQQGGYGNAYNGYDYGQYAPPMGHVMPPRSDPGSDATSVFNCQNGYFYDSLTEKCEKQQ